MSSSSMAKPSFGSRLKRLFLNSRRHSSRGFTLIELLVVVAIAGGIVSWLTFIVVQMMTADQRESARTETQREMQLALDYMATELREAVYIYPGEYLQNANGRPFTSYLPASVGRNSVPVLAFWKYQPFPQAVKNACARGAVAGVTCTAGQSYALVVYLLTQNPRTAGSPWRGEARITRYVLSQFNSQGVLNPGWADPGREGGIFATWPIVPGTSANLQTGTPTGQSYTLVDYVSLNPTLANQIGQTGNCPTGYSLSPSNGSATGTFADRSFYACVFAPTITVTQNGVQQTRADVSQYRDVIIFLRGSAAGRPGVSQVLTNRNQELLPTLQTRVLSRSVLSRQPAQ